MTAWISANTDLLQVTLSLVMAVVWVVYLQMLLSSFLRQRRTKLMINQGAGVGLDARVFVSNLGFEPVYLLDAFLDVTTAESQWRAAITDRSELSDDQLTNPRDATNRGPLKSGESYDIGSFADLIERARRQSDNGLDTGAVKAIRLTVVVTTAANEGFAGATRGYEIRHEDERVELHPDTVAARQIRSRREQRHLRRALEARL